jgi:DeoR family fructose operon transcriptional repressor
MFACERHAKIARLVREKKRMDFQGLLTRLAVSPATLRRDLAELEKLGTIIRVHGGVLDPGHVREELPFAEKVSRHRAAKRAIGRMAAEEIPDGATVFVDAGSTCLEAGQLLLRRRVRIVTHSVALLAQALPGCEAEVICPGGSLRTLSGALVGGGALGGFDRLRADVALISASGLDATGASTTELSEAEVKTALLARSQRRLLLADSSKWNVPSTVVFAAWKDWDLWLTDRALPAAEAKALAVEIQVAAKVG